MITLETAARIWNCHREIQVGGKLLANMEKAIEEGEDPNPRDAFGRQRNLHLGVPSGENSSQLYDVAPKLALSVIRAHIAEKQRELVEANEQARLELGEPQK
jgi:hypothetical protein